MMPTTEPVPRRFTTDEYYRMAEIGMFAGERVELIRGEILKMTPQGPQHVYSFGRCARLLERAFGEAFHARTQSPLSLPGGSEPEPDVAVVRGQPADYLAAHPTTAELVVEVADSTLTNDRRRKAPVYAEAAIPDYWIVNLSDRLLEVYRLPGPLGDGFAYAQTRVYRPTERVGPLGAPEASILVADLLP